MSNVGQIERANQQRVMKLQHRGGTYLAEF